MEGVVYIVTNPALVGWVKIGFTRRTVAARIEELNKEFRKSFNGAEFVEYAEYHVDDPKHVEGLIHALFDTIGGREREREFFNISPEEAFKVFKQVAALRGDEKNLRLSSEPIKANKAVPKPKPKPTPVQIYAPEYRPVQHYTPIQDPVIKQDTTPIQAPVQTQDSTQDSEPFPYMSVFVQASIIGRPTDFPMSLKIDILNKYVGAPPLYDTEALAEWDTKNEIVRDILAKAKYTDTEADIKRRIKQVIANV